MHSNNSHDAEDKRLHISVECCYHKVREFTQTPTKWLENLYKNT